MSRQEEGKVYLCPICQWEMDEPPTYHAICSCCGTHFDYEDAGVAPSSYYWRKLRDEWICQRFGEFSIGVFRPAGYDAQKQVRKALRFKLP